MLYACKLDTISSLAVFLSQIASHPKGIGCSGLEAACEVLQRPDSARIWRLKRNRMSITQQLREHLVIPTSSALPSFRGLSVAALVAAGLI
jgi:hypothetical protein